LTQMVQLNLRKAEDSLKTEPGVIAWSVFFRYWL
jgi:hypothetical protein